MIRSATEIYGTAVHEKVIHAAASMRSLGISINDEQLRVFNCICPRFCCLLTGLCMPV